MRPTHRHADGGFYELVEPCSIKHPGTGDWVKGIAYRGEDGKLRTTTRERWNERFTPVTLKEVGSLDLDVRGEDEDGGTKQIASFTFRVEEVDDLRYMLVTPGFFEKNMKPDQQHWLSLVVQAMADMATQGLHLRQHDFPDMIGDVGAFYAKFGQEYTGKPRLLPREFHDFRVKLHEEETSEYADEYDRLVDAVHREDRRDIIFSLEQQLDALVDGAWVLVGTAYLQFGRGPFTEAWKRVVKANMNKVRKDQAGEGHKDSGREPTFDIVKPAGWLPPDHRDLVEDNAILDEIEAPSAQSETA